MQLNKLDFTVYIQILQKVSIYKKVQERLHMEQTCSYNDDLHKYRQSISLFFKSPYDYWELNKTPIKFLLMTKYTTRSSDTNSDTLKMTKTQPCNVKTIKTVECTVHSLTVPASS